MIERLPTEEYMPLKAPLYLDVHDLLGVHEQLSFEANVILVGPKGIGKSLSVATFAYTHKYPIVTFDCSEDVRRSHLLGNFIIRGDETPFVLGPLTTAFEIANECGHCILCLEEVNALTPQMQKVLNPASDFRKKIEVPEAKRVFRLHGKAKLWVVGTMNTAVYGGTYQLNEDLKSRFHLIPLDYPEREETILEAVLVKDGPCLDNKVVNSMLRLAQHTRKGEIDYALSTRDLVQLGMHFSRLGAKRALWILSGKFDDDDRRTVGRWIKDIFGVVVVKEKPKAKAGRK